MLDVCKVQTYKIPITRVGALPYQKILATAGSEASLEDFESGGLKDNLVDHTRAADVWDVALPADSQFLYTGWVDKVCRIWEVANGELKRQINWHQR
jgi:WD40 repeat protein